MKGGVDAMACAIHESQSLLLGKRVSWEGYLSLNDGQWLVRKGEAVGRIEQPPLFDSYWSPRFRPCWCWRDDACHSARTNMSTSRMNIKIGAVSVLQF